MLSLQLAPSRLSGAGSALPISQQPSWTSAESGSRRMLPSSTDCGIPEFLHPLGDWLAGDAMEDATWRSAQGITGTSGSEESGDPSIVGWIILAIPRCLT